MTVAVADPAGPGRPVPVPTAESRPFWAAARRHELALPQCESCAVLLYPPAPRCPHCLSDRLTWRRLSGQGRLQGWTVVRVDVLPGVAPPFVIGEVELVEQNDLIVVAHLVHADPDAIYPGLAVVTAFLDADQVSYPQFRPAAAPSEGGDHRR